MDTYDCVERLAYNNATVSVHIPTRVIAMLKEQFDLQENRIEEFITSIIERAVAEQMSENNSKVYSEDGVKEIEENLRGLGYI